MGQQTSETPNDKRDDSNKSIGSGTIFIGRERQIDEFKTFLARWQECMAKIRVSDEPRAFIPTSNNAIQGAVVMLMGRGGSGKSMLLNRYRNVVLEASGQERKIIVSSIIDSETIVNRQSFAYLNASEGQMLDPISYYDALANAIALTLGKKSSNCKRFQHARKIVGKAQKKAERVLREMKQQGILSGMKQQDEFLGTVSDYIIDNAGTLIRSYMPLSVLILDLPALKNASEETKKLLRKNLAQMREYLRVRLDDDLSDYINPEFSLGPALGKDLRDWARNYPLLILFDSYEAIDKGDVLLRIVMGEAGARVGWVLTGKDNLWNAPVQAEHNPALRYSYKDIVQPDLGLAVNFNDSKVGPFSIDNIIAYFDAMRERIPEFTNLPPLSIQDAKRIRDVTQGVPLAVKFAAEIFYETGNMNAVTGKVEGKKSIIDQMVSRYLFHTHDDQNDCQKLYSLAMLRRPDQPHAIVAALELTPEQAEARYRHELGNLYQRYSFFFTEKNHSSLPLHHEVRHSLRLWLLEHRTDPEIAMCCKRLLVTQENALKTLEERRPYPSLQKRLQDDEWVSTYLDLTEQQFWSDPVSGLKYLLSFMLAAAIFRANTHKEALEIGKFFAPRINAPYHNWWKWVNQSLKDTIRRNLTTKELDGLDHLAHLLTQRSLTFPPLISACDDELRDVFSEFLRNKQKEIVSTQDAKTQHKVSQEYFQGLHKPDDEKNDSSTVNVSSGSGNLPPEFAIAFNNSGIEHATFERYPQAIDHYSRAIKLDPNFAAAYHNRGLAHAAINKYDEAIADYTQAIAFDPTYALAYYNRGETYTKLRQFELADADYSQAIQIDPTLVYNSRVLDYLKLYQILYTTKHHDLVFHYNAEDIYAAWVWLWGNMGKQRVNETTLAQLKNIAQIDVEYYVAYICRGISLALSNKLKEGLKELETAIQLEPEQSDAYFWKGILCAYFYRGRFQIAMEALQKAVEVGLLPVLLTPLYWLEADMPDFFEQYAKPLLERYGV